LSGFAAGVGILCAVPLAQLPDAQLLADYVRARDQQAFAVLVRRHIDLVYSVALRRTRDPHLANDVTQAVFVILARKAGRLVDPPGSPGGAAGGPVLSAWLHRVTRYAAMDALKLRGRRQKHERKAAEMKPTSYDPEMELKWPAVSEKLDAALDALGETDRRAVMLRFYEGKSFAEVGAALGIAEEAARKRVSRAVEKLRWWLGRRGAMTSMAMLTGLLATRLVEASPPPGLVERAISAASTPTGAAAGLDLAAATLRSMTLEKLRLGLVVALLAAVGLAGLGAGFYAWLKHEPPPRRQAPTWR
jgi:RNA polymerase sigma factor (sigma-70 family)